MGLLTNDPNRMLIGWRRGTATDRIFPTQGYLLHMARPAQRSGSFRLSRTRSGAALLPGTAGCCLQFVQRIRARDVMLGAVPRWLLIWQGLRGVAQFGGQRG